MKACVASGETKQIPATTLKVLPELKNGVLANEPPPAPDRCVWLVNFAVYTHLAGRTDIVMFDGTKKQGTSQGGFLHRLGEGVEFGF